ncbi:hypothetical protein Tco_0922029 [Tanacetum coccineum]|uniref:Uncharacterized protein n=1 Tax=Tanacetum coccineum TaxID=301880 RepID=A0ABQ5CWY6_9ASTR
MANDDPILTTMRFIPQYEVVQPKPKYVRRSSRTKTDDLPKPSSGKRVKSTAKVAKSGKKKQPAIGLDTLSDKTLTEAEQLKKSSDEDNNDYKEDDDDDQGVPDDDQGDDNDSERTVSDTEGPR